MSDQPTCEIRCHWCGQFLLSTHATAHFIPDSHFGPEEMWWECSRQSNPSDLKQKLEGVSSVTMTAQPTELKPCPFCGETEHLYRAYPGFGSNEPYAIDCVGCGFGFTSRAGSDTIKTWNTRASGWRDIESVPKDGTRIDVLLDNNARCPNVHWGSWDGVTPEYECWLDEFNNPVESHLAAKVAHWMPLPPPPQESE